MAMEQYSRLKLTFDEITGAMKFTGQEAVSLQKQVRLLRQELTLGTYTNEQFTQIQKALQETEIKLKQSQIRGKEFFEQIGTLGGPIGELANRIDRAIKLFAALDKMTFKELQSQIENIGKTLSGDVESISDVIQVAQTGGRPSNYKPERSGSAGEAGEGLTKTATIAAAASAASAATTASTALTNLTIKQVEVITKNAEIVGSWNRLKAAIMSGVPLKDVFSGFEDGLGSFQKWALQNEKVLPTLINLQKSFNDITFAVDKGTLYIGVNDAALRALNATELQLITTNEALAISEEGYIVTVQQANAVEAKNIAIKEKSAIVTSLLSNVLKVARTIAIGYNAVVSGMAQLIGQILPVAFRAATVAAQTFTIALGGIIGFAIGGGLMALKEIISGFAEMSAEADQAARSIDNVKKILDLNLADLKRRNSEERAEMEKNNITSAELRKRDLKDNKEYLKLVNDALDEARISQIKAQQKAEELCGVFGVSKEAAEQQAENVKKANQLVIDLEQKSRDLVNDINVKGNKNIEQTTKEGINNRIKAIDAEIEQQIESKETESKELLRLYKERNDLVDYLDKDHTLTTIEEAERRRIQMKKINDAVIEDNVRVIQAEIDAQQRIVDEVGIGTEERFNARREIAQQMFNKEMEEAKKDEKTRLTNEKNARTKYYKDSRQIDIDELNAKEELAQNYLNAESENTKQFFQLERELEIAAYAKQQEIAKGNYDLLEALRLQHLKKMEAIDAKELENKAQMLERKSKTEFQDEKNKDDYTIASLFDKNNVLREINEKAYQDQVESENANYEAQKLRAGTNKEQLEQVELEHLQVLRDLGAQKIETEQQVNLMIEQLGVQFGTTLSNIGNMLLQDAQGRDEKKFKAAKKMAIAGIGIEKAAAIASIWTNNYIANAKARATFWATNGQPFVTINTISAILNTAATIAAAAQAMSAINGTDFQPAKGGSMGRNYATGGMIDGPRHSNGGVPIEAEGGEAVMTRGAVTAFAPLLSMLNVAGGGTSFSQGAVGQAGYDNPTRDGQQFQQAQITKTYVVEQELTTMQQRQARLKNLSTL